MTNQRFPFLAFAAVTLALAAVPALLLYGAEHPRKARAATECPGAGPNPEPKGTR